MSYQCNGGMSVLPATMPSISGSTEITPLTEPQSDLGPNMTLSAHIMQPLVKVKSSQLLRTSPIVGETKKRKRNTDEELANAFADTTNMQGDNTPYSPNGESPSKKRKKLTDEEKSERERQRIEREEKKKQEQREKEERKLKKEEERKQKEEERKQKEAERKQKEEERKQKEAERDEQKRQREEEKRRREEERKKKEDEKEKQRVEREEEKKKKEDERRKREEEKERADEEKRRQEERKKAYWGQFKQDPSKTHRAEPVRAPLAASLDGAGERSWATEVFRAWQPAAHAVVAPLHRWQTRDAAAFEAHLAAQIVPVSISTLPKRKRVTRRAVLEARKARRLARYQHVIDLTAAESLNPLTDRLLHSRFKYLNFHENVRPAYYGTYSGRCSRAGARRPFGKDEAIFGDYDYDSDEDWEEEEGEDLDASEHSEEERAPEPSGGEEDYCYDGEFVVADGYLSDEEGLKSDEDADPEHVPKTEQERALDAERRAERMKKLMAHKKRAGASVAVIAGPVYHPRCEDERVRALLTAYPVELLAAPLDPRVAVEDEEEPSTPHKAKVVPDSLVPQLIRTLHGANSRTHVVEAFHSQHSHLSKRQIERKIVEIAARAQGEGDTRQVWTVRAEIIARYGLTDLRPAGTVSPVLAQNSTPSDAVSSHSAAVDTCQVGASIVQ